MFSWIVLDLDAVYLVSFSAYLFLSVNINYTPDYILSSHSKIASGISAPPSKADIRSVFTMQNKVDFTEIANAVREQFEVMSEHELYVVDFDRDEIWQRYLKSFPEGSNLLFRERTEHDCSCCKHFVRTLGGVVAIMNGKRVSVWDVTVGYPYGDVAGEMLSYIDSLPIKRVFRSSEKQFGVDHNFEQMGDKAHRWSHFVGKVQNKHFKASGIGEFNSEIESKHQVFKRGVETISAEAIENVEDLIASESLYRGDEHSRSINNFKTLRTGYHNATDKELYLWQHINDRGARFRNSVIGTLLVDISEGMELEKAVKSFESKVAPANYKRPKALITEKMISQAMDTINELGLREAISRRHAKFSDVSVNDVLFVDTAVEPLLKDTLAETLMEEVRPQAISVDNAETISVEDFMKSVVPKCQGIDAVLSSAHMGNFMSVTAPTKTDSEANLFQWPNNFAWSYDGDVADSIKERVKRAGGNTDADFRISLSWYNYDDLDIHVVEPSGNEIYFNNPCGKLDVDYNASTSGRNYGRDGVENISFTGRQIADGDYRVIVNQFCRRESIDVGFELEIEFKGDLYHYTYDQMVVEKLHCLIIGVRNGKIFNITHTEVKEGSSTKEKWGINTGTRAPIETLIASPNHWHGQKTGNKHWFFVLRGCKNPEPVRGVYNEFLRSDLTKHRKVFEVLGAKTKAPYSDDQLSGVGFSSTKRANLVVVAKGDGFNRAYDIQF